MRSIPLAALLALAALPARAEPRQFGNVVYDLPADWSVGAEEGGTLTLLIDADDEVCPYCTVSFATGRAPTGDLASWVRGQSMTFVDEDDRGSVEVLSQPEMTAMGAMQVAMMGQRVDGDVQVLMAFDAGGPRELVAFEGWAYDEEEVARTLGYFQSDVVPFLEGLTFVSAGAESLMPEAVAGRLDGLWWGWSQGFTMGLDMMMTPTMEYRTLAFWPDGRFYDGTPPQGLAPLDPEALTAASDTAWGTYREEKGAVVLTFADGEVERLARAGDALTDESRTLSEVEPLPDGARLDGTTQDTSVVALGPVGGAVSGAAVSESSRTYRPDGTWTGSDYSGASATFSSGGDATGGFSTTDGDRPARGTYEVRGGLLVETPSDGSEPALAFVNPDGETMIGELFLETE